MDGLNEEIEQIFSDCLVENEGDKIKSSIIIEAIILKYDLDEYVECMLLNKLDPYNIDISYSKDEVVTIFKDWITPNIVHNDGVINPTVSYISFNPSRSESTPVQQTKKCNPRIKLFLRDDTFYRDSDEGNCESSQSSSSSKKKIIHHCSQLKSFLHTSEIHADSLEKKYESVSLLCENQKVEIDRLKKKLRDVDELEQCIEEMNEQRIKNELEFESKLAKTLEILASAHTKIDHFEKKEVDLKKDISEAHENAQNWKTNYFKEIQSLQTAEIKLTQKNEIIKQLESEMKKLKALRENNNLTISKLTDENVTLNLKINDLQRSHLLNVSHAYEFGVPLCEELPSEMLQFPVEGYFSDSDIRDSINNSQELLKETLFDHRIADENKNYYRCQETQTCCIKNEWLHSCREAQTDAFETYNLNTRLYCCQETQTDSFETPKIRLLTNSYSQTSKTETKDKGLQVLPSRRIMNSHAKHRLLTSRETQTELFYFGRKKDVKRFNDYLMKYIKIIGGIVTAGLIFLVVIFSLTFITMNYCQNKRCFQFRQSGPPPV